MYGLVVRSDLKAGTGELFDALTRDVVVVIKQAEPGTLIYTCHAVEGDADARIFYELYRDRAAFEDHERAEHVNRFHERKAQYLVGEPRVEFFSLQVGKGFRSPDAEALGVDDATPLGERIAYYRRRRGLSQVKLAGLLGRSESWLSQVERGVRSIDRISVLTRSLARSTSRSRSYLPTRLSKSMGESTRPSEQYGLRSATRRRSPCSSGTRPAGRHATWRSCGRKRPGLGS